MQHQCASVGLAAEAQWVIAYWAGEGATLVKVQRRISRAMLRALQLGFISASDFVPGKQPNLCPPENMRIQSTIDAGSPVDVINTKSFYRVVTVFRSGVGFRLPPAARRRPRYCRRPVAD